MKINVDKECFELERGKNFGKGVITEKMILNTWWNPLLMNCVFLRCVWMLNLFITRGNDVGYSWWVEERDYE